MVVLPNTASFTDAQATVTPTDKNADKGAVAKISYTYAGKQVGGANVIYEKNTKATYPFHNISADKGGSKVKYFRIDFKTILLVIGIIPDLFIGSLCMECHVRTDPFEPSQKERRPKEEKPLSSDQP